MDWLKRATDAIGSLSVAGMVAGLALLAFASVLYAAEPLSQTQSQASNEAILVSGQNDPVLDIPALQQAFEQAAPGDVVELQGTFDLTGCQGGLVVDKGITIRGTVDPNATPDASAQLINCGPALRVAITSTTAATLTVQQLWFREQTAVSILITGSTSSILIADNRFTDNAPAVSPIGWGLRFAVASSNLLSGTVAGLVTLEDNVVDWGGAPANATFEGDDNGFAFAATDLDIIIRNNEINTLGEGIEIEGGFGADAHYLVEGNRLTTLVPPSPLGLVDSPANSLGEGSLGGHPAVIKLQANEGTFEIRNNVVSMSGEGGGVCMMATSLNPAALAGESVNVIDGNRCEMTGQLAGILGGWGAQAPFFTDASMHGTVVSRNVFTGSADFGIALVDRDLTAFSGLVINSGHANLFDSNDFSEITTAVADVAFDQETYGNRMMARPTDTIASRGSNFVAEQYRYLSQIATD